MIGGWPALVSDSMLIVLALSTSHRCPRSEYAVIRKSPSDAEMKIKSTTAPTPGWSVTSFRVGLGAIHGFAQSLLGAATPMHRVVQQIVDQVASARPPGPCALMIADH